MFYVVVVFFSILKPLCIGFVLTFSLFCICLLLNVEKVTIKSVKMHAFGIELGDDEMY